MMVIWAWYIANILLLAEWMNLIKSEINEKRPVYYFGSSDDGGHAFVFDGYNEEDMVHVNWGWSGMNNGLL